MDKTEMINYLSKEIETLSTNTMNMRNRISFSLWVGPFLILGSIIVATTKFGGFNTNFNIKGFGVAIILAALGFLALGIMTGKVERGAWDKCNQWRQCIIELQTKETLTFEELENLILYKPIVNKVDKIYTVVFLVILVIFGATAYLANELVRNSEASNPKAQSNTQAEQPIQPNVHR